MNIRHFLTCLLAVLIAVQSMTAMADAHRFHQSGTDHLTFNHDHDSSDTSLADASSTFSQDCHHCCHCHGMAHIYLGGSLDILVHTTLGKGSSNYHFTYLSYTGAPDTPPPIG